MNIFTSEQDFTSLLKETSENFTDLITKHGGTLGQAFYRGNQSNYKLITCGYSGGKCFNPDLRYISFNNYLTKEPEQAEVYKNVLKDSFYSYLQGKVGIEWEKNYSIDFDVPKITPGPHRHYLEEGFTLNNYFKLQTVSTIDFKVDKETREIQNNKQFQLSLKDKLNDFIDAAYDYEMNFAKARTDYAASTGLSLADKPPRNIYI